MAVTFLFTQIKPANLLSIFLKILYVTDVIVIPPTLFNPPPPTPFLDGYIQIRP